jgi:hypothetical protein
MMALTAVFRLPSPLSRPVVEPAGPDARSPPGIPRLRFQAHCFPGSLLRASLHHRSVRELSDFASTRTSAATAPPLPHLSRHAVERWSGPEIWADHSDRDRLLADTTAWAAGRARDEPASGRRSFLPSRKAAVASALVCPLLSSFCWECERVKGLRSPVALGSPVVRGPPSCPPGDKTATTSLASAWHSCIDARARARADLASLLSTAHDPAGPLPSDRH